MKSSWRRWFGWTYRSSLNLPELISATEGKLMSWQCFLFVAVLFIGRYMCRHFRPFASAGVGCEFTLHCKEGVKRTKKSSVRNKLVSRIVLFLSLVTFKTTGAYGDEVKKNWRCVTSLTFKPRETAFLY